MLPTDATSVRGVQSYFASFFGSAVRLTYALLKSATPSYTDILQTLLMLIRICGICWNFCVPSDNIEEVTDIILFASEDGFCFKPVNLSDVILAISHFSSLAKGVDGVPQSVLVKALPIISNYITNIFNSSFAQGIFPGT